MRALTSVAALAAAATNRSNSIDPIYPHGEPISQARFMPFGEPRWPAVSSSPTDFTYTGQRSDGFGLMDYRARFYSPLLGRFVSADTIVPNPGKAVDFDRYAYGANNPLRYRDPSGHGYCDSEYAVAEECAGWYDIPLTHAGDPIQGWPGKTRRYGGDYVYDLYIQYRDTEGWWNNNTAGILTVEEFVGLYILFESNTGVAESWLETANVLSTIFAQNLYVGGTNPATCEVGGTCFNAVFNFIAANIDGDSALLAGPNSEANQLFVIYNPGLGNPEEIRERMSSLGGAALDPSSVVLWDRYNGPSMWGNIKGAETISKKLLESGKNFGTAIDTVYYLYLPSAVYFSVYQYNYWKALGVDMTLIDR